MTLDARIRGMAAKYQEMAQVLEIEAVAARRECVRKALQVSAAEKRAVAEELQGHLDAAAVPARTAVTDFTGGLYRQRLDVVATEGCKASTREAQR